ncbi:hypothetical protein NQD34_007182 [Periophthalmus magnuspinnatus]|nr:hypothetical protein NQD34_007182 [Periophthalmus magnuspinnatus]
MFFKVNPTEQNIQTEQGALVTGVAMYSYTLLCRREAGGKCLTQNGRKTKREKDDLEELKPTTTSTCDPLKRGILVKKTAWHQSPNIRMRRKPPAPVQMLSDLST